MEEFLIYGYIGRWGVEARQLAEFLKEQNGADVVIRVNSYGGSAYDGLAMFNLLKDYKGHVTAYVDGAAMSAATLVCAGANRSVMNPGAVFMVHDVSGGIYVEGTAEEVAEEAAREVEHLEKLRESIIDVYTLKTGLTREEMREIMDKETYYTAEEAAEKGFVDEAADTGAISENVAASLTLQRNNPSLAKKAKKAINAFNAKLSYNHNFSLNGKPAEPKTPAEPAEPKNLNSHNGAVSMDEIQKALAAAKEAEAKRRADIARLFKDAAQHKEIETACLLDQDCSPEMAKDKLLAAYQVDAAKAAAAPKNEPTNDAPINVGVVADESDKKTALILDSWTNQAAQKFDGDNPMNGVTLQGAARMMLSRAGAQTELMHPMEIVDKAMSMKSTAAPYMAQSPGQPIADFPGLLKEFVRRAVGQAFTLHSPTWQRFCTIRPLSDFRATEYYSHGISQTLAEKDADGNYPSRKLSDAEAGSNKATQKGAIYALKRESLYNDDLGELIAQFNGVGSAAGRTIEQAVFAFILSNPTLPDGKKLFDASRGNLLAAAPMTAKAWHEAELALANQKAINTTGDAESDEYLDLRPHMLLTSVNNLGVARGLITATVSQPDGSVAATATNGMFERDNIVTTQRLAGKGSFYFADPRLASNILVGFVRGQQSPFVEFKSDFASGDPMVKVGLDFGVGIENWRGVIFAPHGDATPPDDGSAARIAELEQQVAQEQAAKAAAEADAAAAEAAKVKAEGEASAANTAKAAAEAAEAAAIERAEACEAKLPPEGGETKAKTK